MHRALILCFLGFTALSQAADSHGYIFVAPGGVTSSGHTQSTLNVGAGFDAVVAKGIGFGLELGALGPTSDFSASVGIFSADGSYHFQHDHPKLDPYVTGGYTLLFRSGHANLGNFGGGVNYWFHRHLGLKFEFRDHIWPLSGATAQYWGFRVGLAFR